MTNLNMNLQHFSEANSENGTNGAELQNDSNHQSDTEKQNGTEHNDEAVSQKDTEPNNPQLKYSDEDVNRIVQAKLAKETQKREEAVKEAERQAKMTADQKKDYQLKKAEEEKQQALNELNRFKLMKQVRSELSEDGLNLNDDELGLIVSDDEETTNNNINIMKNLHSNIVQQVKNDLLRGSTPKTATAGSKSITAKQFDEMSSLEKTELFKHNRDAFNRITGE